MRIIMLLFGASMIALVIGFFAFAPREQTFGVTFSPEYATELGVDWHDAYSAMLADLHPRVVRIPVPWDRVELAPGQYELHVYDWMLEEAEKSGAQVVLAIGAKVPRWPECHVPTWASSLDSTAFTEALLGMERYLVLAYRDNPALARWQVENEPLFPYGDCPTPDASRIAAEVGAVRDIDPNHPIVLTSSGEQSNWLELSSLADVIGVSLYRFTWSSLVGPLVFPHSPLYYRVHAALASSISHDPVVISELQMEPWYADGIGNDAGNGVSFSAQDFDEHVSFARSTGISEVWLWGVEWWYREKVSGRTETWDAAKELFAE